MDLIKWIKSFLKALLLFGIVLFVCWIYECVLAEGKLNFTSVALSYMLSDTIIRYYEKEGTK